MIRITSTNYAATRSFFIAEQRLHCTSTITNPFVSVRAAGPKWMSGDILAQTPFRGSLVIEYAEIDSPKDTSVSREATQ